VTITPCAAARALGNADAGSVYELAARVPGEGSGAGVFRRDGWCARSRATVISAGRSMMCFLSEVLWGERVGLLPVDDESSRSILPTCRWRASTAGCCAL